MFDDSLKVLKCELRNRFLKANDWLDPLYFVLIALMIFPFTLGTNTAVLQKFLIPMIMIVSLFVSIISSSRLFEEDYEDGTLEQLLLTGVFPSSIFLGKALSHIISSFLPVIIIMPMVATMFDISMSYLFVILLVMGVISIPLSFIAGFSALLVLGTRRGAILKMLITLPFTVSFLIFATMSIESFSVNSNLLEAKAYLVILLALSLIIVPTLTCLAHYLLKNISNTID
jgi:heme exporter protein B